MPQYKLRCYMLKHVIKNMRMNDELQLPIIGLEIGSG